MTCDLATCLAEEIAAAMPWATVDFIRSTGFISCRSRKYPGKYGDHTTVKFRDDEIIVNGRGVTHLYDENFIGIIVEALSLVVKE